MSSRGGSRGGSHTAHGGQGGDRGGRRGRGGGHAGGGRGGGDSSGCSDRSGRGGGGRGGFGGGNAEIIKPEYTFQPQYEEQITSPNPLPQIAELIAKEEASRQQGDPLSPIKRPGYGTVGISTKVGTNFVKLDVSNLTFFSYHVTFQKEIDAKQKVKKYLLEILISKEPFLGLREYISHDGSSSIYSTKPIPIEKDAKVKFVFETDDWKGIVPSSVTNALKGIGNNSRQPVDTPDPEIFCTVEFIHRLAMDDLIKWTKIDEENNIESNAYVQALNTVLGYKIAKHKDVFLAGKNKFC